MLKQYILGWRYIRQSFVDWYRLMTDYSPQWGDSTNKCYLWLRLHINLNMFYINLGKPGIEPYDQEII